MSEDGSGDTAVYGIEGKKETRRGIEGRGE